MSLTTGPLRIAVIAAIIPFFANFSITQNGVYRDYVALVAGGLALLLALISLPSVNTGEEKGARIGIIAGVVIVGLLQIVRGLGFFQ